MPTGYTSKLHEGKPITFSEFVMDCARAFSANVMLRDAGGGGEKIPERYEPERWHQQRVDEDSAKIARLEAMSDADADAAAASDWHKQESERMERLQETLAVAERYDAMLAQVQAWTPPTTEHVGLKRFMVDQLIDSRRFDCGIAEYYKKPTSRLTGHEWRSKQLTELYKSLARNKIENLKEIERTNQRNAWNRALRESLKAT